MPRRKAKFRPRVVDPNPSHNPGLTPSPLALLAEPQPTPVPLPGHWGHALPTGNQPRGRSAQLGGRSHVTGLGRPMSAGGIQGGKVGGQGGQGGHKRHWDPPVKSTPDFKDLVSVRSFNGHVSKVGYILHHSMHNTYWLNKVRLYICVPSIHTWGYTVCAP